MGRSGLRKAIQIGYLQMKPPFEGLLNPLLQRCRTAANESHAGNVLRDFLPIHVRAVVIIPIMSREWVYTYDLDVPKARVIGERVYDQRIPEAYPWTFEDGREKAYVEGWVWARAWSSTSADHKTVEIARDPAGGGPRARNTHYRTRHVGMKEEETER